MLDKRKVLLIDYDLSFSQTLKNYLIENDFTVVLEPDSLEAVTTAHVEEATVILIACDMPGLMGHQLVKIFKDSEELEGTPLVVIASSANNNGSELVDLSIHAGADEAFTRHDKFSDIMKKLNKVTGFTEEETEPVSLLLF